MAKKYVATTTTKKKVKPKKSKKDWSKEDMDLLDELLQNDDVQALVASLLRRGKSYIVDEAIKALKSIGRDLVVDFPELMENPPRYLPRGGMGGWYMPPNPHAPPEPAPVSEPPTPGDWGGSRKGAGRPKGAKNLKAHEFEYYDSKNPKGYK